MAVNADPGQRLRQDPGPAAAAISADRRTRAGAERVRRPNDEVADRRSTSCERGDSDVVYGNLLTLPVGGGLLYVEPVYVQAAAATAFPLLRKVLVAFGGQDRVRGHPAGGARQGLRRRVRRRHRRGDRRRQERRRHRRHPRPARRSPGTGDNAALSAALADAQKALRRRARRPCKAGDFAAYGEAQAAPGGRARAGRGRGERGARRDPAASPVADAVAQPRDGRAGQSGDLRARPGLT